MLFEVEDSRSNVELQPVEEKYGQSKSPHFLVGYRRLPFQEKEGILTTPDLPLFNILNK